MAPRGARLRRHRGRGGLQPACARRGGRPAATGCARRDRSSGSKDAHGRAGLSGTPESGDDRTQGAQGPRRLMREPVHQRPFGQREPWRQVEQLRALERSSRRGEVSWEMAAEKVFAFKIKPLEALTIVTADGGDQLRAREHCGSGRASRRIEGDGAGGAKLVETHPLGATLAQVSQGQGKRRPVNHTWGAGGQRNIRLQVGTSTNVTNILEKSYTRWQGGLYNARNFFCRVYRSRKGA